MNFQLPRHKVQHSTDVFAKAHLFTAALITDLLLVCHIMMMFNLRQRIQTQLSVGSLLPATGGLLVSSRNPRGVFGTCGDFTFSWHLPGRRLRRGEQTAHLKQMLLQPISHVPFTPGTVDPPAKQSQFVDRPAMFFAKLSEIIRGAIQNLFEIGVSLLLFGGSLFPHDNLSLLLCHQSMALCKVTGKGK